MVTKGVSTQQDTGWGVIYRLNDLFREVENLAPSGKYDEWNFKLDRIFSNLCYRNPLKIKKNGEKIVSINLDEEAYRIKLFLDYEILKYKSEMSQAKKDVPPERQKTLSKEWVQAKKKLYKAIFLKEIWLRKYMQELGLYLKEVEHNPAGAMWGK
jgi:hypothetical protein